MRDDRTDQHVDEKFSLTCRFCFGDLDLSQVDKADDVNGDPVQL